MYNFTAKIFFLMVVCVIFLVGCERETPSPVDIKIDDATPDSHVIINNETLYDIAYKYGVDPMNLAKINGLNPPYTLRNGQVLQLPKENSEKNVGDANKDEKTVVGYEAVDTSADVFDDNDSANYEEPMKSKKEIDESFDSLILSEASEVEKADNGVSALSTPKVTATAVGVPITKKSGRTAKISSSSSSKVEKESSKELKMKMPVNGKIISHFGDVNDGVSNDGINIKAPKGKSVSAAVEGDVIYAGNKLDEEYGNVVIIQHNNGLITSYAHLDKINVKKGAHVHGGDIIGAVGSTGDVDEPQLYFEIMKNKKPVNPAKYLKK